MNLKNISKSQPDTLSITLIIIDNKIVDVIFTCIFAMSHVNFKNLYATDKNWLTFLVWTVIF